MSRTRAGKKKAKLEKQLAKGVDKPKDNKNVENPKDNENVEESNIVIGSSDQQQQAKSKAGTTATNVINAQNDRRLRSDSGQTAKGRNCLQTVKSPLNSDSSQKDYENKTNHEDNKKNCKRSYNTHKRGHNESNSKRDSDSRSDCSDNSKGCDKRSKRHGRRKHDSQSNDDDYYEEKKYYREHRRDREYHPNNAYSRRYDRNLDVVSRNRESAWNRLGGSRSQYYPYYPKGTYRQTVYTPNNKNENPQQTQSKPEKEIPKTAVSPPINTAAREEEIVALKQKIHDLQMSHEIDQLKMQFMMPKTNPFLETHDSTTMELMKLKEKNKQYLSYNLELKRKYDLKCAEVQKLQLMLMQYQDVQMGDWQHRMHSY